MDDEALLCAACGSATPDRVCGQCERVAYCSAECTTSHWLAEHSALCVGHKAGEQSPPVALGYVMTVGNFTMVRLLTLNEDAVFQVARAYAADAKLTWTLQKPHAWKDYGTGPHVTLSPAMKKYNGEFVDVELGPLFHFTDAPSNWVAFAAKLPSKFQCPHGCHVSVAQQRFTK